MRLVGHFGKQAWVFPLEPVPAVHEREFRIALPHVFDARLDELGPVGFEVVNVSRGLPYSFKSGSSCSGNTSGHRPRCPQIALSRARTRAGPAPGQKPCPA